MPMRQKPTTDSNDNATKNQQLIPHDQSRKNHEREPPDRDGGACRHATDKKFEWRIKDGRQAEHEHRYADPHNSFETGELRAEFARGVPRNCG